MDWLKNINIEELASDVPILGVYESLPAMEFHQDEAVRGMLYTGKRFTTNTKDGKPVIPENRNGLPGLSVWIIIKSEIKELICTDSKKYENLRGQLSKLSNSNGNKIIPCIAAYLGGKCGVEAAAIAGLISVALYSVIKISKETYCAYEK
jgi:hypothetical protein